MNKLSPDSPRRRWAQFSAKDFVVYNAAAKSPRNHVMDHAWEMEDKDLTNSDPASG